MCLPVLGKHIILRHPLDSCERRRIGATARHSESEATKNPSGLVVTRRRDSSFRRPAARRLGMTPPVSGLATEIFQEELGDAVEDVDPRGSVGDTVAAAGIEKELGVLLGVDECIG